MSRIWTAAPTSWSYLADASSDGVMDALERGAVVFFPRLTFQVEAAEQDIFSPAILSSSKNSSYDPATGRVGGTTLSGDALERLRAAMARFSAQTRTLVERVLPSYAPQLQQARASFRPAEVAGRQLSWRKDDTRLHVDAFPASPVQGRRILRVFSNVNPEGRPRTWRVGGEFEPIARRFLDRLVVPFPGTGAVLRLFRVTKSMRSSYDALMLQLHDRMKEDREFQETTEQERVDLPAGSTWMCFTDQVGHAATAGQYQFEQTFLLPVSAMSDEQRSPLRILERLKGRRLT